MVATRYLNVVKLQEAPQVLATPTGPYTTNRSREIVMPSQRTTLPSVPAHRRRSPRHGWSTHPLYNRWRAMLHRCSSPSNQEWANYGGRGITVCERWQSFESFLADMGDPPAGMTLDRIDNDGPYSPENCRWVTQSTNRRNARNNVLLEHGGVTKTLAAWAESLGLPYRVLHKRLRDGWTAERTVTTPRLRWGNTPVTSPAPGVHRCGNRWRAMLYRGETKQHLGVFDTWEEAAEMVERAKKAYLDAQR